MIFLTILDMLVEMSSARLRAIRADEIEWRTDYGTAAVCLR